jgi:type IV secretory pathway component VirB8
LSRESLVEITQAEAYAPIYVRLAYTPQAWKSFVIFMNYETT